MSSLTGIVRNLAWPSTGSSSCVIALISNPANQLAPGTINLRLGAVRRLAYEAADCGLLSADLAAGIRRVKGVKKLGIRLGNWLPAEQGNEWVHSGRIRSPLGKQAKQQNRQGIDTNLRQGFVTGSKFYIDAYLSSMFLLYLCCRYFGK